jgi:4-hydroxy-3-methylbut-2-enyl diphosphate reductase
LEVIIGNNSGMCAGVKNALKQAEIILSENENVFCLGEFVHNSQVVLRLENKGMTTIEDISKVPNYSNIIFRTHGVTKQIYERAERKGLKVFDLTCPNVKAVQEKIIKEQRRSFVVIIGKSDHPEVTSYKSFAGSNSYIVDDEDEIYDVVEEFKKSGKAFVYVVSQTTFSSDRFDELAGQIREELKDVAQAVMVDKTICRATENRQEETKEMSSKLDYMVIIGGKNSSNTNKLYDIASKNCKNVFLAQTKKDLRKLDFEGAKIVGIMAGASTPDEDVQEIKEFLEKI